MVEQEGWERLGPAGEMSSNVLDDVRRTRGGETAVKVKQRHSDACANCKVCPSDRLGSMMLYSSCLVV
jgi:hypothetical protein